MNKRERGGRSGRDPEGKWGGWGGGGGEAGSQVGRQANRLYPNKQVDGQVV